MKQCPTCQSQYTDDTLQYCLQDGTPLQPVGAPAADYGEQETVVSGRQSDQYSAPRVTNQTNWNPNQSAMDGNVPPAGKKSNATFAVFVTVFVMLLIFSFVGIGAWFYYRGAAHDPNSNLLIAKKSPGPVTANANTSSVSTDSSKTPPTPPTTTSSNTATNATPAVDKEQVRRDVAQRVNAWKAATEAGDVDEYMSYYAPTVDYYNKKGAGVSTVRADKERAFAAYDSMRITVSNLTVTPDASGETAVALFDKEWVFEGEKRSAGKVQSQLRLKKVKGQWLITGERDLKVYYTE